MLRKIAQDLARWKVSPRRKPLILKGARQVGKTYSLQEFGKQHFENVHTVNFEARPELAEIFAKNLIPARIIEELSLVFGRNIDSKTDLIIFDEIQVCANALTSLKYFAENLPQQAICSAGSLLGLQLNPGSFPVGKVDFLTLHPCSYHEFLGAMGQARLQQVLDEWKPGGEISGYDHEQFWHYLKLYFICGGLPEVIVNFVNAFRESLVTGFDQVRLMQKSLINSYLADVAKHSGKVNSMHIDRVWRNVPLQLSMCHDQSSAKFKFRDVVPGIHGYNRLGGAIDWLMKAGLIVRIPINFKVMEPLLAYTKDNLFKLMMFDVGILGALANLEPQTLYNYEFGTYKGYFAENFVAQELVSSGHDPIFSWHEGTAEIEFLMQDGGGVFPIEVKSGNRTKAQSLRIFSQKYNPHRKVVVCGRAPCFDKVTKTEFWPLYAASKL
jgi:predicted AAA+ superfamily ATPase